MNAKRILPLLVIALLAAFDAAGLLRAAVVAFWQVPLDPNEGWNAYHAAAAASGALYPGAQSWMMNNYPPLSFYLIGALGELAGDHILAGRLVALLALLVLVGEIYVLARRLGCTGWQGAFAPLFFLAGMIVFTDYVGMDDPQLLADAVAAAGLLVLLDEPRRRRRLAAAAFLFAAAFFIKHNVIAMALAGAAWLTIRERLNAFRLVGFGLGFFVAGLVLFNFVYGTGLLAHLLNPRTYSTAQLWMLLKDWLGWNVVPLAGLAILAALRQNDSQVRLIAIYAVIAVTTGAVFLGGAGVDVNAMFDADLAVALGAALTLNRLTQDYRGGLVAAAFAAPVLFAAADSLGDAGDWLHPMQDERRAATADIAFLKDRPGPALCQMLSFCYWAHKPAAVDVFNIGQAFRMKARNDDGLVRLIDERRFAVIQFEPDEDAPLGRNVRVAMDRAYRLDHEDDCGSFYVPK